ncbi:sigma-70 family RNA polymerase sigma factor [Ammoniphilus sp. CFH 90114]|uniref:sigma-70 family RNA polymerase sigma factor n=1 Tax=Ammoniphilus sp. CFH 90114 TaxID=2493665 RepID=UPI00100ED1DA|nr:sigma-70 family RNA polymerase sigma factor [Ammoniphilus sp. CFH 90114]RXT15454.1 sigma-70 family RNA polymerase sigma factor [Ammoniphilus sp. CFH 90114]
MSSNHSEGEETKEMIQRYQKTQNEEIATQLLLKYDGMIQMAARKLTRSRPDLMEDLFQVGRMSVLRSLNEFDPEQNTIFEAYAMKSLMGHMKNYLRDKSWYIQVPRRIKEKSASVQQMIDHLTMKLERSPQVEEIANHLNLSEEETIEILVSRENYQLVSLETPLSKQDDSVTLGDMVSLERDELKEAEKRLDIEEALEKLGEEERKVVHLAFLKNWPQRKIANHLNISQMSVSRVQKRALQKLKKNLSFYTTKS